MAHLPPGRARLENIVARNLANHAVHTRAEGGQVELVLARIRQLNNLGFSWGYSP